MDTFFSRIRADVFISYSEADKSVAEVICQKLSERGISYFIAEKSIQGGDPFKDKIRENLQKSKELFLLLTPNSLKSAWVTTEWGAAWALGKHIVPILHRCAPEDLPSILSDFQARDLHEVDKIIDEYEKRHRKEDEDFLFGESYLSSEESKIIQKNFAEALLTFRTLFNKKDESSIKSFFAFNCSQFLPSNPFLIEGGDEVLRVYRNDMETLIGPTKDYQKKLTLVSESVVLVTYSTRYAGDHASPNAKGIGKTTQVWFLANQNEWKLIHEHKSFDEIGGKSDQLKYGKL